MKLFLSRIFIVLVFLILVAFIAMIAFGIWGEFRVNYDQNSLAYIARSIQWESITAGLLGLGGGYFVIYAVERQIHAPRRQQEERCILDLRSLLRMTTQIEEKISDLKTKINELDERMKEHTNGTMWDPNEIHTTQLHIFFIASEALQISEHIRNIRILTDDIALENKAALLAVERANMRVYAAVLPIETWERFAAIAKTKYKEHQELTPNMAIDIIKTINGQFQEMRLDIRPQFMDFIEETIERLNTSI